MIIHASRLGGLRVPLLLMVVITNAHAQVNVAGVLFFVGLVVVGLCFTTALAVGAAAVARTTRWESFFWALPSWMVLGLLAVPLSLSAPSMSLWAVVWALGGIAFVATGVVAVAAGPGRRLGLLALAFIPNLIAFVWVANWR